MSNGLLEGLSYVIKPSVSLDDFIKFCRNGKTKDNGEFDRDSRGYSTIGVINWLLLFDIFEANFFTTSDPAKMFFVSVEENNRPWLTVGGLMEFIETGPVTIPLPSDGQIKLKPATELDAALRTRRPVFEALSTAQKERFKAATGINDTDPAVIAQEDADLAAVIAEIEQTSAVSIRGLLGPQAQPVDRSLKERA